MPSSPLPIPSLTVLLLDYILSLCSVACCPTIPLVTNDIKHQVIHTPFTTASLFDFSQKYRSNKFFFAKNTEFKFLLHKDLPFASQT
mmetsp:Transcript_6033/g.8056  ORF Transcript_6033/g.8056 Transcript_6033/m.8056 type:complete len:87 (-) Transcript_6033:126-386(-)